MPADKVRYLNRNVGDFWLEVAEKYQGRFQRTDLEATASSTRQAFTEFRRKIGIEDKVRFHDARGLIIDQMSKLRVPREFRSHILHHTSDMHGTLAEDAYSTYDYAEEKLRALRLWSIRLQDIVRGRKPRALRW